MSKKVLIMSASTGGGHNRAAHAIKDELDNPTIGIILFQIRKIQL